MSAKEVLLPGGAVGFLGSGAAALVSGSVTT